MSIARARFPSLEFNWLPNSIRKGLSTPRVVYTNSDQYGGRYIWPDTGIIECFDMDTSEGAIIEVTSSHSTASILAHEFRHHWQRYCADLKPGKAWRQPSTMDEYKKQIIRYFRDDPFEMDALCFEIAIAPSDISLMWKEWILEHQ